MKRSPRRCVSRRPRQKLQRLMLQTVQALAGLWHPARLELLANRCLLTARLATRRPVMGQFPALPANRRPVMETAPIVSRSCSTRSSATVSTAAKLPSCAPSKGLLPNNFIEGMVCTDGCIGGAACLSHGNADKRAIDNYGKKASHKEIRDVL